MQHAVIGSGAVGSYYGGRLAQAGMPVEFLCRSDYAWLRDHDLDVRSWQGDFRVRLRVHDRAEDMARADVILVALKAAGFSVLPDLLPPLLKSTTLVVCLLNGLGNEERLAEMVGTDRVIAGAPFICSERIAPGVIRHTASGGIRFAAWGNPPAGSVSLADLRTAWERAGIQAKLHADPREVKWGKLLWNVPFSGISVLQGGITTDRILDDPGLRRLAEALMREVIAAAATEGVRLEESLIEANFASTSKMGAYRTSMMVDYVAGRPIELESIIGEPLRRGERAGVPMPRLRELYETMVARAR